MSRPIVVGGPHRSGTSLVRRILDAHSRIHCGPEVTFFRDLTGDFQEDPLRHLRFAQTARSLVDEATLLEVLGTAYVQLHERAAGDAGKPRWADKSPDNVLHLDKWERILGNDWQFVLVLRNPVDTIGSMVEAGFPLTLPSDLGGKIQHFIRYAEAGLDFVEQHPNQSTLVLYEDLTGIRSEEALSRMMGDLGEHLELSQLCFNEVPHQSGLEDPKIVATRGVEYRRVRAWDQSLAKEEVRRIQSDTRDLHVRLRLRRDHLLGWS
jgi:hypothetical protein